MNDFLYLVPIALALGVAGLGAFMRPRCTLWVRWSM